MPVLIVLAIAIVAALLAGLALWLGRGRGQAITREDIERLGRDMRADLASARTEQSAQAKGLRDEVGGALERVRESVEQRLAKLTEDNTAKLEQMRQTVDEKLQTTLEKRLNDAFGLVSERLEQVHKGLGEMQTLATGVGDLKRVLTNVKTRGTWGEVQLGNLLEQMFSPDQYEHNFMAREGSAERVEYAVRYPGGGEAPLWLPIDSKYPAEDYERLVLAAERADAEGVETASKALENRVRGFAKEVADKYINPPRTTDYAFLFLPTEGLYAELLRRPGFMESLLRDYHVNLCGPTTLAAMLTGVVYGFRRIAIQARTREIQDLLGAVKSEFARFGEALDKVRKKIDEAGSSIDQVSVRRRAIERKLRDVESMPISGAQGLLSLAVDTEADGADDGE